MSPGRRLLGVSLLALLLLVPGGRAVANAGALPDSAIQGVPTHGAVGITERLREIMQRQALTDAAGERPLRDAEEKENERPRPDRTHLPQNPESPDAPSMPILGPGSTAAPGRNAIESPQAIGTSFTGATLSGTNPTGAFPPDCMGAVGPTQFVVFVNGRLVTFNKTTGAADGAINADPDVFFASVRNGSITSDPRIRYDRLTGRWFLVIINTSTPNRILLAVSAAGSGTLTGGSTFTFFYIPISTTPPAIPGTCFADYPTLGVDANALYIGTNDFCGTGGNYNGTDAYVVRKSSVMGPGPIVVTAFRQLCTAGGAGPYTPQGVDNFDPGATEGYLIGSDNASYGLLQLRRVSNPGGTPTLSANIPITVAGTNAPVKVQHQGNTGGSSGLLDCLDDRLFAAHIRNGQLWTAHNIGVTNTGATSGTATRDAARWYHLDVPLGAGTPTVVEYGTLYTASAGNTTDQRSYWIPSIMVSGQGHAAMSFGAAGAGERANTGAVGRWAGDAPGTLQAPTLITGSTTAYNPPGDPGDATYGRRWGDYSYVSLDPIDDMTMWAVGMFCDATNSYGVRVTKLVAPPPATPALLADVTAGQPNVTLTLTGASSFGSGFYDPGANLPGVPAFSHLAAAVTNGSATGTPPAVVSATYLDPTTVQLVLDASAATANVGGEKYTLTITNPDGQTASAAIVHVTPALPVGSIAPGPTGNEGNAGTTAFDFTVNLSAASASAVTVRWQTVDGTATAADSDYAAASDSLTIAPGFSSGTIHVGVNGDTKYEADETFSVTLTGATGATLGAAVTSTGTILNDDAQPALSIVDVSQLEGNAGASTMHFTVTTPQASALQASVDWATVDGTATVANGDYAAGSGTLALPPGATSGTIDVSVNGDTAQEPDETFTVVLSAPVGASIAAGTGTGTIRNDDAVTPPTVTVIAPNGGESVEVADNLDITWSAADSSGVTGVDVLLSRDGGATYAETLAAGLPNTGTWAWTVTPPATAAAFVRVAAHDGAGSTGADASDAAFEIADHVTGVALGGAVTTFDLGAVRPNPARGAVAFAYQLPREADVRLSVVDVQGRELAVLACGATGVGRHTATWSGTSANGQAPNGLYFVRYAAGGKVFHRRFALIR